MTAERDSSSTVALLTLMVLASAAAYPVGLAIGVRWLLPVLNTVPAYVAMVILLRRGRRDGAVGAMLLWAATLAVCGTLSFRFWPTPVDAVVWHGPEYRAEMFHWIRTGIGREGHLSQFLPQHLLHLAAFVVLSLATASALSIFGGAVLMNYMDFYVASLGRAGVPGWATTLFGWQPWALCRVAAFCILGVVLSEPLLGRLASRRFPGFGPARRWLAIAAALLLADWVLKAALAPTWGLRLRALLPALP
jgi:hypothetical protein